MVVTEIMNNDIQVPSTQNSQKDILYDFFIGIGVNEKVAHASNTNTMDRYLTGLVPRDYTSVGNPS